MAPIVVIILLSLLSLTSSSFLPEIVTSDNKLIVLLTGLGLGFSTIFEEIGWTGFVTPKLRQRYGSLSTGLIVGFMWGIWHLLPTLWGSGDSNGLLSINLFIGPVTFYFLVLPIFRIIMVKAYDHTNSLLLATIMHGVLTASTVVIFSPQARGFSLSGYYIILAVAFLMFYFVMRYKLRKAELSNDTVGMMSDKGSYLRG
jgi:membrane protease YdiL (CAAX protease family)